MKYNIGLFNDSFPPKIDGVANTVYNYASILSRLDVNCTVVTPKYPGIVDDYPFDVIRYSSTGVSKKLEYRVGNVVPVKTLGKLINKDFDLLHVHSPFVSSLVADDLIKLNPGLPVVLTYHKKFDVELEKRLKVKSFLKVAKKFVLRNINLADEVWVVSEGAVESLRAIGYKGDYRVIRNGADFKKGVSPAEKTAALKKSLNIAEDDLVFLFVGRMMWYKNIKLILSALRLLPNTLKFKMVFVGDGNDRHEIENHAKHIGISTKCIFTGAVYDREVLRDYYSMSDLFIFPSTYDTSGLVVMEAAATKLPAVLIRKSCAAEGVTDGRNGFLCEENEKSLKDAILRAVSDREHLTKAGENAQSEVYCSWEDSVRIANKRYEEIIENYKPKRTRKDK
ncbi:MAG: glycosyltransferase [Acutalibacteraceae bacterium]|nr:glycosyltransferase [Acutalibacteraceae bacterium]